MLTIPGLEVATSRRARGRGLLGRDGIDGALWLPGVRAVHTVGMRFALDVAWLAGDGRVLRVRTMAPRRASAWVPRAAGVLEAEAGAFARWGLSTGGQVDLRADVDLGGHAVSSATADHEVPGTSWSAVTRSPDRVGVDRVNGDGPRPGRDRRGRA